MMSRTNTLVATISLSLLILGGCSSHKMAMKYQPSTEVSKSNTNASVAIGQVVDNRNTAPNWLGAIRGGYGNPLKKIYTDINTADAVAAVLEQGLKTRGLLAQTESSTHTIDVDLTKFDASQMFRKEAHANFTVTVTGEKTGQSIFNRSYQTSKSAGGSGPGVFGSTSALGNFANLTLNEGIDKLLDDPDFLAALRPQKVAVANNRSTSERLKELETLKTNGLITELEYLSKRQKLLENL